MWLLYVGSGNAIKGPMVQMYGVCSRLIMFFFSIFFIQPESWKL